MPYCSSWHVVPEGAINCAQCGEAIATQAPQTTPSAGPTSSSTDWSFGAPPPAGGPWTPPPPGGFGATPGGFSTSIPSGFCSSCGNGIIPGAYACTNCGTPTPRPMEPPPVMFCSGCGSQIPPGVAACSRCGVATRAGTGPKDKTTSVLLAVLLGHWAWLYTYDRDKD